MSDYRSRPANVLPLITFSILVERFQLHRVVLIEKYKDLVRKKDPAPGHVFQGTEDCQFLNPDK